MKKVLFVATVVQKHIQVFHLPFLKMFQENGYRTYVSAANDTDYNMVDISYCDEYEEINFKRNPLRPGNLLAYFKLKKLIDSNEFDIIHCHTPVGGLLGRLTARKSRKKGTRVYYTAHGFHFYKGAPLLNWLVYYPVEKFCSRYTDKLITINKEDYELAKRKFKAKEVYYVPGVGIDLTRFENLEVDRSAKRREIGIPEDAFMLLSVGELNGNKNHQVVIKALAQLNDVNVHYAVAGVGEKKSELLHLAHNLGVSKQVHLLGYRNDIPELNHIADVFCFPSIREGLGLAAIEGMASGLPIIAADNRGTREYVKDGINGFLCVYCDVDAFANAARTLMDDRELYNRCADESVSTSKRFGINNVLDIMKEIYERTI